MEIINIKIKDQIKYKDKKQIKDMNPSEIGVLLKDGNRICDETDLIILYRTNDPDNFDVINLSGIDSGYMFINDTDSWVGILDGFEVDLTIRNNQVAVLDQKKRTVRNVKEDAKDHKVQGQIKIKMAEFYNFVEMENPVCGEKISYSNPEFNLEKGFLSVDFSVD